MNEEHNLDCELRLSSIIEGSLWSSRFWANTDHYKLNYELNYELSYKLNYKLKPETKLRFELNSRLAYALHYTTLFSMN